jgi:hypothetical protein
MNEQTSTRLGTVLAITVSILTLFSGLLGWHLGNIKDAAADAYLLAQQAELNSQKVISTNTLNAYENHRAFLAYKNYFDQYNLVSQKLEQARQADPVDEGAVADLSVQRDELQLLYLASLKLFNNKFIERDGTYNLQEQLGQMIASDARKLDINPDPHKQRGRQYDTQARNLQMGLIVMAVSLFFFAIVSTVQNLKRFILLAMTVLGYLTAIAGVTLGLRAW